MKSPVAAAVFLALTLLAPPKGAPKDERPTYGESMTLYGGDRIVAYLTLQKHIQLELKITKQQETAIKTILNKHGDNHPMKARLDVKGTPKEQAKKIRAMDIAEGEELLQTLSGTLSAAQLKRLKQLMAQSHGSMIFELPEARALLDMSDKQAKEVASLYDKIRADALRDFKAKKLTAADGQKLEHSLSKGVPPQVRATLTPDQQKALNDLLGEPYDWPK